MPYPYPRFTDGPDAESHLRAFVATWHANHSTQRLPPAEIDTSQKAEFTLSLDGPAARWYSRFQTEVVTFQEVRAKFLELFHREIPKRELL